MLHSKGFTLIELLVVISIIGLLASIVLASLNSTRAKAKDAAVQTYMTQVRTVAEDNNVAGGVYQAAFKQVAYSSGTIPPACVVDVNQGPFDSNLVIFDQNVLALQGVDCQTTNAEKGINIIKQTGAGADSSYFAYARLPSTSSLTGTDRAWWCVDSSGNSKKVTGLIGTDIPSAPAVGGIAKCP